MTNETRQVEWTEEPHYMLGKTPRFPGDRDTFPKARADKYIEIGVAMDPATGEKNERKPGQHKLIVNDINQQNR